jgi:hypothetical protein
LQLVLFELIINENNLKDFSKYNSNFYLKKLQEIEEKYSNIEY